MAAIIRADSRKRVFPSSSSEHSPQPKRRRTTDTRSPSLPYANIAPSSALLRSNPAARPVIVAHSSDDISARLDSAIQHSWGQKVQDYRQVHVLLFFWEDDDILVSNDVAALEETFRVIYGFQTTVDKIKAPKANKELLRGVLDFLQTNDSPENLLVVYYVGDCEPSPKTGEAPLWVSRQQKGLTVQSGQIQAHLQDADADVLMLWDCSLGPLTTGRYGQSTSHSSSVSEVLTAGAYNTVTSGIGEETYTRALIEELPKAAKSGPVRVIDLHAQLLNRLGTKKPIALNTVYRAPSHGWLSPVQRSIVLAPLGLNSDDPNATRGGSHGQLRSRPINGGEVAGDVNLEPNDNYVKGPSVTVCFRVSENDANQATLENWLAEAPRQGRDAIKIKGQFAGFSPLISLTIPLHVWATLPECPAQGLKAFATTGIPTQEVEDIEQALFDKMEHEEPAVDVAPQDYNDSEAPHKMEDAALDDGYALRNSPKKIRKALPTGRRLLPSEPRTLLPSERRELPPSVQLQHRVQPAAALSGPAGHSPVAATERKALPTSRKPVKISIKSAGPLLHCPDCTGTHFRDDETLAAHKRKHHTRPFQCVFNWAGCTSDFASKNEWKRHVMSQHILLHYWLCDLDSCRNTVNTPKTANGAALPNGSIFNRKDLYTQHLRRMHTPPNIKKQLKAIKTSKAAPSAEMVQWEEHLKDHQKAGYRQRCSLPTYMRCPAAGCSHEFQGANAWDDRMEHVAKHLEKAAAGKEQRVTFGGDWDPTLTAWASRLDVGIVVKSSEDQWKLVESPLKASRSTTTTSGALAIDDGDDHAGAVRANGNGNSGSPDEDDEDRDRERSRSVIEVAEGQHHDHDDLMEY